MRRCVEELVGAARTFIGSECFPTEGEEGQLLQRLACSSVATNAASGDRPNRAGTDRRWSKVSRTLIDSIQVASAYSHPVSLIEPHHRVGHELSEPSLINDRSPPRGPFGEDRSPHHPSLCVTARVQPHPLRLFIEGFKVRGHPSNGRLLALCRNATRGCCRFIRPLSSSLPQGERTGAVAGT